MEEKNSVILNPSEEKVSNDFMFRMILTGQIKQLQLFWVDKRNPDKVINI